MKAKIRVPLPLLFQTIRKNQNQEIKDVKLYRNENVAFITINFSRVVYLPVGNSALYFGESVDNYEMLEGDCEYFGLCPANTWLIACPKKQCKIQDKRTGRIISVIPFRTR